MKFLFLLNSAPYISEYFGSLCDLLAKLQHEIIIYVNSEYSKKYYLKYYPKEAKIYERNKMNLKKIFIDNHFLWKNFYESWDRKKGQKIFNDYSYVKTIIEKTYSDIREIIEREKPDYIVHEPPANILSETAFFLSKEFNIKYLGFIQSRIPGRIDVYDEKYTHSSLTRDNLNKIRINSEDKDYFVRFNNLFLSHELKPDYLQAPVNKIHNMSLVKYYIKKINRIPTYAYLNKTIKKNNFIWDYETLYVLKFQSIRNNLSRKVHKNNYKKYIDEVTSLSNKDYFVFPLHLQPEASTSGQATYFSDLLSTIKYIAFSLPYPNVLAVKEHPSALGTRSRSFYKELKKIPNVIFLDPHVNNEELIEKSKGVITLTSTLGLEAALKGKLVLILGKVFYNFHPNCVKVKFYDEISDIIKKEKPISGENELENINSKFWKMYKDISIEGTVFQPMTEKAGSELFKLLKES